MIHPLRRVALPTAISGGLWLTEMPGRAGPLSDYLTMARDLRITGLVCLVAGDEIATLSPDYATARADGLPGLTLLDFPIPDFGVPSDTAAFADFVTDLGGRLMAGERLMIHCAAGIGRTGMTAAMVLRATGLPADDALAMIRAAGSGPETPAQMEYVLNAQPAQGQANP
ncbi:Protein tyrosine phosphatase [Marinibacterium anthonyi]|nr:Protein tyrosine phosphatase [Marinibacterium anthonyi]